jgi:hypothetical protein
MDFKTLEKRVRVGLWIWGTLIAVLCICGFIYSLFYPVMDPNAPLPPGPWDELPAASSVK